MQIIDCAGGQTFDEPRQAVADVPNPAVAGSAVVANPLKKLQGIFEREHRFAALEHLPGASVKDDLEIRF